jgi:formylmethanofuran dehydrogenase subunit B
MDSVPIRMQKVLDSGLPGDEEVLSQILHLIQKERQSHGANVLGTQSPEAPPVS